ncbi:hypothetical protein [Sphingomonas sp. VDB2]|uniref:hypothetical protein n=1 Tax=Sphingomonas sp. VDB2 TaxID=3228751 RepID=UPI003A7F6D65
MPAFAAIAAIALLAATQDSTARIDSDLTPYWSGDEGWRVFAYPGEEMCDLGFPTAFDEYVTIGYKPRVGTSVMITNKHATSLRAGEVKSLVVVFGSEPERPFTIKHVMPFDVHEVDAQRVLSASPTYKDFLADFASSGFMAVLTPQGTVVSAIKLDGSSRAVEQLRTCAYEAAKLDPQDPFLAKP